MIWNVYSHASHCGVYVIKGQDYISYDSVCLFVDCRKTGGIVKTRIALVVCGLVYFVSGALISTPVRLSCL